MQTSSLGSSKEVIPRYVTDLSQAAGLLLCGLVAWYPHGMEWLGWTAVGALMVIGVGISFRKHTISALEFALVLLALTVVLAATRSSDSQLVRQYLALLALSWVLMRLAPCSDQVQRLIMAIVQVSCGFGMLAATFLWLVEEHPKMSFLGQLVHESLAPNLPFRIRVGMDIASLNIAAVFMVVTFAFALTYAMNPRRPRILVTTLSLGLVVALFIGSRAGDIAMTFVAVATMFVARRRWLAAVTLAAASWAAVVLLIVTPDMADQFSLAERARLWNFTLTRLITDPRGMGLGVFPQQLGGLPFPAGSNPATSPHNAILQFVGETGISGALALTFFGIVIYRSMRRALVGSRFGQAAALGFLGYCLVGVFESTFVLAVRGGSSTLILLSPIPWLLLVVVFRAAEIDRRGH